MIDSYIQSLAELFSALTLIYLLNETKKVKGKIRCVVVDSIRAYPFDMKYASFVYGSAEDLLGTLYQFQLNKYFGIPFVAKSLLTTSKHPDAHAAAEKSAHTMAATLAGARCKGTGANGKGDCATKDKRTLIPGRGSYKGGTR
jgi:trimethylamine:corrinoid methyltransferase-like protein